MKGISALIIIGLILWAFSRSIEVAPPAIEKAATLYERYRMKVPITKHVEEEIRIFPQDYV